MADNNLFSDLENYRKLSVATHIFKNTSGGSRFFAYVGPNGKELANNAVECISERAADFTGVLAKQAILRDMADAKIKFGTNLDFYHLSLSSNTANTSLTIHKPGTVVAVFMRTTAGLGGDETLVLTAGGTSVVNATAPIFTAASATSGKAKEAALHATAANLVIAGQTAITRLAAEIGRAHV